MTVFELNILYIRFEKMRKATAEIRLLKYKLNKLPLSQFIRLGCISN
jgi:hypothetical protein